MSTKESADAGYRSVWLGELAGRLARALYVLPAGCAALALAAPVIDFRLQDRGLSGLGELAFQLGDLEYGSGARLLVGLCAGTLLLVLALGLLAGWDAGRDAWSGRRWLLGQARRVLGVAGTVLVLAALVLPIAVAGFDEASTFRLEGPAMMTLTGVVAWIVMRVERVVLDPHMG